MLTQSVTYQGIPLAFTIPTVTCQPGVQYNLSFSTPDTMVWTPLQYAARGVRLIFDKGANQTVMFSQPIVVNLSIYTLDNQLQPRDISQY